MLFRGLWSRHHREHRLGRRWFLLAGHTADAAGHTAISRYSGTGIYPARLHRVLFWLYRVERRAIYDSTVLF